MRRHNHSTAVLFRALLAALLFCLPQAQAQDTKPSAPKKGMFWKVTNEKTTLYLLGSIHAGTKDMYPLPKEINDAFDSSSSLIVEVDMTKLDMGKMQSMMMDKGMYKDEDNLWNHVSPETKAKVEEFCVKYGLPSQMISRMRPWMAAMMGATIPMLKGGFDPNLGIDKHFMDKAKEKKIVEIESAEWQIELLSSFDGKMQDKYLAGILDHNNEMGDKIKKIQQTWLTGDIEKMDQMMSESAGEPEDARKILITNRNVKMTDFAEQSLKGKETAFLIVGAGHMVGKEGIVKLLEKRGYTVEQVAFK